MTNIIYFTNNIIFNNQIKFRDPVRMNLLLNLLYNIIWMMVHRTKLNSKQQPEAIGSLKNECAILAISLAGVVNILLAVY